MCVYVWCARCCGRAALEVLSCWVLTCPPSSLSELTRGRTLKQLTRRLATAHRIADEGERLWVVETAFRILRALAGSSAAAMGGSLAVRQLVAVGVPQLAFAFLRDMQQQQQQQTAAVNIAADAGKQGAGRSCFQEACTDRSCPRARPAAGWWSSRR